MKQLPENWVETTLDEVAKWGSGGTPSRKNSKYFSGSIPWIKTGELGTKYIKSAEEHISSAAVESSSAKVFPRGSVGVAMYGATIGKVSIWGIDAATNQACAVAKCYSGVFNEFLYYFLFSQTNEFVNAGKGGAQPNISQTILKSWPFVLPPTEEQMRIVAKIEQLFSELDPGIESLISARKQLSAYRQSVLKSAFDGTLSQKWRESGKLRMTLTSQKNEVPQDELAKFPALPLGWTYDRLGSFLDGIDAGKSFKCEERIPETGEIGVAKVSAVTWGEYNENESKTCIDAEKVNPRYFIKEGDFLFSRANTIELVGACVIAKKVSRNVMLSDKTLRFSFQGLSPFYFMYYLRSYLGRMEIMQRSTGNQESMRNIGQDRIKSIVVPICSKDEADYILGQVQEALSAADYFEASIEAELLKSAALRKSIMKEAFSGRLVDQDPRDEAATALLERIRAERTEESARKERGTRTGKRRAA